MTEIERLQIKLSHCLLIMGTATSFLFEMRHIVPKGREKDLLWIIQAIENVVYKKDVPPPFPER
jgi:hypothetical protein